MTHVRYFYPALMSIVLAFAAVSAVMPSVARAEAKAEAVRAEVGKPLQVVQELLKAQKYKEALAKLGEADAIAGKTPYEIYVIERMRGAAATGTGDNKTALKAFEAVIASGRLSAPEQLKIVEVITGLHYRAKDYGKAASWAARYLKEGGTNPQIRTLLVQSHYLNNDCASVASELKAQLQSGASEEQLQMLASCYSKQDNTAGYLTALEKLVAQYPKKSYWADLLNRVQAKPGFAPRLDLDVYRLKFATGNLDAADEYMEMAQLALQEGFPAEAKKVVDQGFSTKILGAGNDTERQLRLQKLVLKNAAEDQKTLAQNEGEARNAKEGTALVNVGFAYVTSGQYEKGLALMEEGIRKGSLKHPEDAKLHLGLAYVLAGQKAKATQTLKTVQGKEGAADLARLWILHAQKS